MELRDAIPAALPSDQDPAYLHPGRVVLILIQDLDERDPDLLSAGALAESRQPELRVSAKVAEHALGPDGYAVWRALPPMNWSATGGATDGEVLEALVTADDSVRRIALSEALDQLRHAHRWESGDERARAAELAREVLAPAATRTHAGLERRFNWWIRRVGESLRFGRK
jgi:hypothetical protein